MEFQRVALEPDAEQARRFLAAISAAYDDEPGQLEIIAISAAGRGTAGARHFDHTDVDAMAAHALRLNETPWCVYVGTGLRRGAPTNDRAHNRHVAGVRWLRWDVDDGAAAESAVETLRGAGLEPTFIVRTGSVPGLRLNLWFRLSEMLEPDVARAIMKAGAPLIGADKAPIDASRVMRIPGAISWPKGDKPGRVAERVEIIGETDVSYSRTDVETALARLAPSTSPLDFAAPRPSAHDAAPRHTEPPVTPAVTPMRPVGDLAKALRRTFAPGAAAMLAREAAAVETTPDGGVSPLAARDVAAGRNNALHSAAFVLGGVVAFGAISRGAVEAELVEAGVSAGLAHSEAAATARSGLEAGMREPRTPDYHEAAGAGSPSNLEGVTGAAGGLRERLVSGGSLAPLLDRPYLVKGWLDRGAMSVVYGESNVGKSFFALDVARAVAEGSPWAGCRVRGGPVLYVASEGGRGFVNRVAALACQPQHLHVLPAAVDLHAADADAMAVAEIAGQLGAALVIVDTLARSMGDGDENAAPDMGRFVRNTDAIREATGAHMMVIHHIGKDRTRGARGHSSLRAATDTEIELEASGETIVATTRKQRDMAGGRAFAYRLREVELGRDQDGDPVTTCIVEPADAADAKKRKPPTGNARAVLEALRIFADDNGRPNPSGVGWPEAGRFTIVDATAFREFAAGRMTQGTAKRRGEAVSRALGVLEGSGWIGMNGGSIWAI